MSANSTATPGVTASDDRCRLFGSAVGVVGPHQQLFVIERAERRNRVVVADIREPGRQPLA